MTLSGGAANSPWQNGAFTHTRLEQSTGVGIALRQNHRSRARAAADSAVDTRGSSRRSAGQPRLLIGGSAAVVRPRSAAVKTKPSQPRACSRSAWRPRRPRCGCVFSLNGRSQIPRPQRDEGPCRRGRSCGVSADVTPVVVAGVRVTRSRATPSTPARALARPPRTRNRVHSRRNNVRVPRRTTSWQALSR